MFRKISIVLVTLILVVSLVCFAGCNRQTDEFFYVFGTQVELNLTGKGSNKVVDTLSNLYNAEDADFDATNTNSSIYKINNAHVDEVIEVSEDVYNLILLAKEMYLKTGGVFNIATYSLSEVWKFTSDTYSVIDEIFTLPRPNDIAKALLSANLDNLIMLGDNKVKKTDANLKIGLGAIAKGYAGDISYKTADLSNMTGILNVGGTIFTVGDKTFNIGISSPRETQADYFAKLTIAGESVVCTSGDYERYYMLDDVRYCHILGSNGYPVQNGIVSVTILSTDRSTLSGAMCDILSTAVFALGSEDGIKLANEYGAGVVIIYDDYTYETVNIADGVFTLKDTSYSRHNV